MTPGPGQALFVFVRHWARRPAADQEHGRLVVVLEAVHTLGERGLPTTVNTVAHAVGIDQSGVSRLMRDATAAGYLTMRASTDDARRREARLTAGGRRLLVHAHRWQEQVFDELTAGWSERRRREFHRAMTDLIDRSYAVDHPA